MIDELCTKNAEYSLTAADLKLGASAKTAKGVTTTTKLAPKTAARYRNAAGEEWLGGRGRKLRCVTAVLAAGKSISHVEIK